MSTIHHSDTRGYDNPLPIPKQSPIQLVSGAQTLATSATLSMNEAVAKRRAAGRETIHLGFGEASFPLHPLLAAALAEVAKHTAYAPVLGIPKLRQAIADSEAATAQGTRLHLRLAVDYSAREAIYHAACRFYKVTELSPASFSNVLAEVHRGGSTGRPKSNWSRD